MEIKRPLKRGASRLGLPDIYPQDPRQKEDELNSVYVKQGYSSAPLVSGPNNLDEFGSAKHANIDAFGVYFSALLSEKHRINTLEKTQKKKQLVNTKEIWYVHAKTKNAVDNWLRDLASGNKTLSQLGKRIPTFNTKDGMFLSLFETQVPFSKAVWFIKMSTAHSIAQIEAKTRKRPQDPSLDLTQSLCRYLKKLLTRIMDLQNQQPNEQHLQQPQQQQQLQLQLQQQTQSQHLSNHDLSQLSSNNQSQQPSPSIIDPLTVTNEWQYLTHLARYLFDEGLLDQQEFLCWLLELIEKTRNISNEVFIKIICPLITDFVIDFTRSAVLSRRLGHICAKKLSHIMNYHPDLAKSSTKSNKIEFSFDSQNAYNFIMDKRITANTIIDIVKAQITERLVQQIFGQTADIRLLKTAIYVLSSIIQVICIECPTAMVRLVNAKPNLVHQGSPLDHLTCLPSDLPVIDSDLKNEIQKTIFDAERQIFTRSSMSDTGWSCDNTFKIEKTNRALVNRLLSVIDALDKHNFDKVDTHNSFDTLYNKVFSQIGCEASNKVDSSKTSNTTQDTATNLPSFSYDSVVPSQTNDCSKNLDSTVRTETKQDETFYDSYLVKLLCDWAVTPQRTGEYRAFIVAKFLERRQGELLKSTQDDSCEGKKMKKSNSSSHMDIDLSVSYSLSLETTDESLELPDKPTNNEKSQHPFQSLLVEYLDLYAPSIEDSNDSAETKKAFSSLVLLYWELIQCDVFSHYSYMCTLISRGMFSDLSNKMPANSSTIDKNGHNFSDHNDDVDRDLKYLLQDIKEGQQDDDLMPDYLGSVTPAASFFKSNENKIPNLMSHKTTTTPGDPLERRHSQFVKHFPVPNDESFLHDSNQRNNLIYGFGVEREEARHVLKKLTKEICKLYHRRICRDISEGGKFKKTSSKDNFNPEATITKFTSLSHYDQYMVTNSLSITIMELYSAVASGQSSFLPCLESLSFTFDLFSIASNICGLLDLTIYILELLPDIENQIKLRCPPLTFHYCQSIAICAIGILSKYHSCVLLLLKEDLTTIFESLQKLVSHILNPALSNTSSERLIFSYLYELYTSQTGKFHEQFSSKAQKIKQTIYASLPSNLPNQVEYDWLPTFLIDIVNQAYQSQNYQATSNSGLTGNNLLTSIFSFNPMNMTETRTLYMNDSPLLKQIQESARYRYGFVCDAIHLSATSQYTDMVNEIAILCADISTKCHSLMIDWIVALRSLCCPSQTSHEYRILSSKINISDFKVMDNLAVFTAVLVARKCINLNDFILRCALNSVLAPIQPMDRSAAEPGVRLTSHILLSLFRARELPSPSSSDKQSTSFTTHSPFGPASANFNYGVGFGGTPLMMQSLGEKDHTKLHLKNLSDYYMLRSACSGIKIGCLITLLKAIRLLAISASPNQDGTECIQPSSNSSKTDHDDLNSNNIGAKVNDLFKSSSTDNFLNDVQNGFYKLSSLMNLPLHQFADVALRLICSQRWLHDKCVFDSDAICTTEVEKNILIDPRLEIKQSQRLLYMICYSKSPDEMTDVGLDNLGSDQVKSIVKIFENLDFWNLRLSLMRLKFMFAYCKSQSNTTLNEWLDNLARAVVEFYQKFSQNDINPETPTKDSDSKSKNGLGKPIKRNSFTSIDISDMNKMVLVEKINSVWLVELLLERLVNPVSMIQSRIVKATASLMESASVRPNAVLPLNQNYHSTAAASTKFKERNLLQRGRASTNPSNLASTSLLGFYPFLSFLISCLKNLDKKEKETLLSSINSQLYQAIHEKIDDVAYQQSIQEGLELRLCLIGRMFGTIQKSATLTQDWATLLLLMINHLVDPQIDYKMYVTVLDMLATLIQSAYASDSLDQKEEARKQYQNFMKMFRKELEPLVDKGTIQMKLINSLMPLNIRKPMTEVVKCEPMRILVDTKGEKLENFYSIEKKEGLKVKKIKGVSPWDLIEGHKNPAPLKWPWFGAIKLEQRTLRADENNRLMAWHTHKVLKPANYYYQPPRISEPEVEAKPVSSEKKPSESNPLLKSLIEASEPLPVTDSVVQNAVFLDLPSNHASPRTLPPPPIAVVAPVNEPILPPIAPPQIRRNFEPPPPPITQIVQPTTQQPHPQIPQYHFQTPYQSNMHQQSQQPLQPQLPPQQQQHQAHLQHQQHQQDLQPIIPPTQQQLQQQSQHHQTHKRHQQHPSQPQYQQQQRYPPSYQTSMHQQPPPSQQHHMQHQQYQQQHQQYQQHPPQANPLHQMQPQQQPYQRFQQPPPQQQQQQNQSQMFTPQQVAGHARPALTAMLNQRHAATANMGRGGAER